MGEGILKGLKEEFEQGHEYYKDQMEEMKEDYSKQIAAAESAGKSRNAGDLREEFSEELEALEEEMNEGGYGNWEDFMSGSLFKFFL